MIWIIRQTVSWGATLFAVVVLVRGATLLASICRSPEAKGRGRDWRWLFGWVVLILIGLAVVHCEAGGFHSFRDPAGGEWDFEGYGWPLTLPGEAIESGQGGPAIRAICCLAIGVDLLSALLLMAAVRLFVDRLFAAWDEPHRCRGLGREAGGLATALAMVLLCERLAARPITLPGTELIVYSTLVYEVPEVRAGMLFALGSALYLTGRWAAGGLLTLKRLRDEGVI